MQILDKIHEGAASGEGGEVAMLVNNLGSTPLMETYIMANAALKYAQDKLKVGCDVLACRLLVPAQDVLGIVCYRPVLLHACHLAVSSQQQQLV